MKAHDIIFFQISFTLSTDKNTETFHVKPCVGLTLAGKCVHVGPHHLWNKAD